MFERGSFPGSFRGRKDLFAQQDQPDRRFLRSLDRAVKLGLLEDKRISSLLKVFQQTGKASPGALGLIEQLTKEREQQLQEVPFVYPRAAELQGEIPLGKLYQRREPVSLRVQELFTHMLISGASGFGKTNTIVHLARSIARQHLDDLTVIVFDTEKGDLASIAESVEDSVVLVEFPDDIFVPPPIEAGSDMAWQRYVNDYLNRILEHIAMLLWSNVGERSLELKALRQLWDRGFFAAGRYPTLEEFVAEIMKIPSKKYTRREDRKQNIEDKFSLLKGAFSYCEERSCLDIEGLLEKRLVVVDLSSYDEIRQQLLMVNIIEKLYFYQLKGRGRELGKKVLIILDEALPLIRSEANTISGIPPLVSMMAKIRSSYIGFCLCVQNPSLVHPIAAGNASTHVIFRQEGKELEWASRLFGLMREQKEFVHTKLKPGVALLSMGTRNLRSFPMAFPRQEWGEIRSGDEFERVVERGRQLVRPVIEVRGLVHSPRWLPEAQVTRVERAERAEREKRKEKKPRIFYQRQRKLLEVLAADPSVSLTELYRQSGVPAKYGIEVRDYWVKRGWAEEHEITTGRRGGKIKCLELTREGKRIAGEMGIEYRGLAGKGSFEHRFWQHRVKVYYETRGYLARIEGEHPGLDDLADVSLEKAGERLAVEVELSVKHVLENVRRDFDNEYDFVMVVVTTPSLERSVKQRIDEALSLWRERMKVVRASMFLEKKEGSGDWFGEE